MKQMEIESIVDMILLKRQDRADRSANETVSHLFSDLKKDIVDIKSEIAKLVVVVENQDGRLGVLEKWMEATKNYSKGLVQGSKGTWITIASAIGIGWVVFGEFIKKKLGL